MTEGGTTIRTPTAIAFVEMLRRKGQPVTYKVLYEEVKQQHSHQYVTYYDKSNRKTVQHWIVDLKRCITYVQWGLLSAHITDDDDIKRIIETMEKTTNVEQYEQEIQSKPRSAEVNRHEKLISNLDTSSRLNLFALAKLKNSFVPVGKETGYLFKPEPSMKFLIIRHL